MSHNWIKSTLGHGESMCSRCFVTNMEAAALGVMNTCDRAPEEEPIKHESKSKHRTRAVEALARQLCETDMTNGFCCPRDGKCQRENRNTNYTPRDCISKAEGLMKAMETVGVMVVWPYDKDAAI